MRRYSSAITMCVKNRWACARHASGGAEDRCPREERLDRHETERLVPLRGVPYAARAREQRGLLPAVHLPDVLDRARETRSPAAGDDEPVAGVFGGFDGPVVTLRAVEVAEKQIELLHPLGKAAEDVLRGIEPVVDEDLAPVTAGVVARQEDGVDVGGRAGLQVAVDRV